MTSPEAFTVNSLVPPTWRSTRLPVKLEPAFTPRPVPEVDQAAEVVPAGSTKSCGFVVVALPPTVNQAPVTSSPESEAAPAVATTRPAAVGVEVPMPTSPLLVMARAVVLPESLTLNCTLTFVPVLPPLAESPWRVSVPLAEVEPSTVWLPLIPVLRLLVTVFEVFVRPDENVSGTW